MNKSATRDTRRFSLPELAAEAGMTVRNVRSYQTRGLIPPPARHGRRSVYNEEHLERLQEIRQARSRGATLGLISTHLSRGGELATEDIAHTWLPLHGVNPAGRERASNLDNLLSPASMDPEVTKAVDSLVSRGLIRRTGTRLVADRDVAQNLGAAIRRGVPVLLTLQLMDAAADAGVIIGRALENAMSSISPEAGTARSRDKARTDLAGLAASVLSRRTVVIDLAAAERPASRA